jgi:ubiquitin C-terminal hydrolase
MGIIYEIVGSCCKKRYNFGYNYTYIFGLKNLGNTCFMNSSLQCIFNSNKLIKKLENIHIKKNPKLRLANEISLMLKDIKKGQTFIDPKNIKDILGEVEEKYKYFEQNDANEFITIFLNELLKELNGIGEYKIEKIPKDELEMKAFYKLEDKFFNKNKSFLLNLFYGRLKRQYICENGHICAIKFNNFNTLILPHPEDSNDIVDLLKVYQKNKSIDDTIFCNTCQSEKKYSIKTLIYNIPDYFILFIEKETIYSYSGLKYPKILETKDFTNNSSKYSLNSFIVYLGDRERGHYTAKYDKNNNWYHFSDANYKIIEQNNINDKNAIILFYEKI